ncbi:O-fucosyltransferase 16 [Bienertia sinuspersici]
MGEPNEVKLKRGEFHENPSSCICENTLPNVKDSNLQDNQSGKEYSTIGYDTGEIMNDYQNYEDEQELADTEDVDNEHTLTERDLPRGSNKNPGVILSSDQPELDDDFPVVQEPMEAGSVGGGQKPREKETAGSVAVGAAGVSVVGDGVKISSVLEVGGGSSGVEGTCHGSNISKGKRVKSVAVSRKLKCKHSLLKLKEEKSKPVCKADNTGPSSLKSDSVVSVKSRYMCLSSRMSPSSVCSVMKNLSPSQKKAVNEIGFGSLEYLKVTQIPLQLGYWLVKHFDANSCSLVIPGGDALTISEEDVHEVLGLPIGGEEIELDLEVKDIDVVKQWKSQFSENCLQVSIGQLKKFLESNKKGGDMFKRNFVVLCVSTLMYGTQNTFINHWILRYLGHLFYVDKVAIEDVRPKRQVPIIKVWTTTMLHSREKLEMSKGRLDTFVTNVNDGREGGYAQGTQQSCSTVNRDCVGQNVDAANMHSDENQNVHSDVNQNVRSDVNQNVRSDQNQNVRSDQNQNVYSDPMEVDVEGACTGQNVDDADVQKSEFDMKKECIMDLAQASNELAKAISKFQEKAQVALMRFPDNEAIKKLEQAAKDILGEIPACEMDDERKCKNNEFVGGMDGLSFSQDEEFWKDPNVIKAWDDIVAFSLKSKNYEKDGRLNSDGPTFSLGISSPSTNIGRSPNLEGDANVNGERVNNAEKLDNEQHPVDVLATGLKEKCSVVVNEGVGADNEKKVVHDQRVLGDNVRHTRSIVIKLREREESTGVVGSECKVDDAKRVSKRKKVGDDKGDDGFDGEKICRVANREVQPSRLQRSPFKDRLVNIHSALTVGQKAILESVFSSDEHKLERLFVYSKWKRGAFYLMRFQFHSFKMENQISSVAVNAWSIILNANEKYKASESPARFFFTLDAAGALLKHQKDTLKLRNDKFFEVANNELKNNLFDIKEIVLLQGSLVAKDICNMGTSCLEFDWKSSDDHQHCGVALMRHMESYKGLKKWDCGLRRNDISVFEKLRSKYCCSIICSDINEAVAMKKKN